MSRTGRLLLGAGVALALVVACTDSYLYDPRRDTEVPADRTLALEGRFCSLGSNEVRRPIKIVIAMDASQSMRVSDPDGTRATALVELIENLPQDPEVSIAVMLFAGSTTAFLTQDPGPPPEDGFVQVSLMDAAARNKLTEQLLTFRNTDTSPNRDSTDFVKPLADIYSLINTDIARSRQNPDSAQALALARYSVIFLSDGHPTNDQRDELIDGDAVVRIRQLRDLVEDVRVNTVHVFNPTQPVSAVCDVLADGGIGDAGCPLRIINRDAQLLEDMSGRGGGNFRDFRNNEPINFLNFQFGQVRRAFVVKEVVASNFSAPPGSPLDEADSDGDGLSDAREAELRTNPLLKDTDGDGFSDGVEVYFADRGVDFDPTQVQLPDGGGLDKGCPPALRAEDTDCDGLLDCDEQFIGTNASLADSDRDGVTDGVEWRGGTQGSSNDLDEDPDSDGLTSRAELRLHTRPLEVDTANLAADGYRYTLEADGPPDENGRQCYRFRVDNVLLAPTQALVSDGGVPGGPDAGVVLRGAGYNDIYLSVAMVPGDDPTSRTLVRTFRVDSVRYPVGGIKSPPDGVIRVNPEDFVDGCPGRPTP